MDLRMSKDQRQAFLADLHVGVISIADPDPARAPLAAPIWYDYSPEAGLWIVTGRQSRKGRALEKAGRFSLVAQNEGMPYQYVSVEGPIVEARPADVEQDTRPMAHRYFGAEMGDAYIDSGGSGEEESFLYVMRPERWLTVDYARLAGSTDLTGSTEQGGS
ncbi:MAG: pyridoxamine 5'-phosphate oxidase family protein [Myxococcota bacterium]|nr:pyridoxamine 5'-phosphate oxidase family protein [Myxococcota bacterium]